MVQLQSLALSQRTAVAKLPMVAQRIPLLL